MESIELKRAQDHDNYAWIRDADENQLVVGTQVGLRVLCRPPRSLALSWQARILYADAPTRVRIGLRFNQLVKDGAVGPVMLGRGSCTICCLLLCQNPTVSRRQIITTLAAPTRRFAKLPTFEVRLCVHARRSPTVGYLSTDGSNIMADMAHQCWAGNAARGMTMCVLSNGGGVGTGKAINGG